MKKSELEKIVENRIRKILKEDDSLKSMDLMEKFKVDDLIHALSLSIDDLKYIKKLYYEDSYDAKKNLTKNISVLKDAANNKIIFGLISDLNQFKADLNTGIKHYTDELKSFNKIDAPRWIDADMMSQYGISSDDINYVVKAAKEIATEIGDSGTVVLGAALTVNGDEIITAYSQGNIGPERIYTTIKKYLTPKYPKLSFNIEWGNMD